MKVVEHSASPPPASGQLPQRHAVSVQAMVSGLGTTPVPLVIRDISRRGMYLVFDESSAAIDEQWLSHGAALTIEFAATVNGQRCRVSAHAQIRRRDRGGIGVRLSTQDDLIRSALRSLVMEAMATRDELAHISLPAGPASKAEQTIAETEALLREHVPNVLDAYLNGIASSLMDAKYGTPVMTEQRRYMNLLATFEKSRPRIQHAAGALIMAEFGAYLRSENSAGHARLQHETALALVESSDLRASLAITEAMDRIGALLRRPWEELALRMSQLSSRAREENPLHPGAICFRLRNAIFDDPALGALRQIDLTAGFTPRFAQQLEALYRALNTLLERCGIHAKPST